MVPLDLLLNNLGRGLDDADAACSSPPCTLDEDEFEEDVTAGETEDDTFGRAGSDMAGMAPPNAGDVIFGLFLYLTGRPLGIKY